MPMINGWPVCDRCRRNIGYDGFVRVVGEHGVKFKDDQERGKVYCYPLCVPDDETRFDLEIKTP